MSRRLLTIFGAIAVICGYLFLGEKIASMLVPAIIAGLLFIITWAFQHKIDWMWYQRHPPKLDASMHKLFSKRSPFYRGLTEKQKKEFGQRVSRYVLAKEFIGQGHDKVAEDLKYMVAYYAILLAWNRDDYLLPEYDRIVFYLHPFLSPNHNEHVHTYEVEHTDGTIILSIDELVMGFLSSDKYYQTGLHAMAEAYLACYPVENFPELNDDIWDDLKRISGFSKEKIESHIGLKQEDPRPMVVHHYISYADKFAEDSPDLYKALQEHFGHVSPID